MDYFEGGSLQDFVENEDCLEESVISNIMRQILEGLKYLH